MCAWCTQEVLFWQTCFCSVAGHTCAHLRALLVGAMQVLAQATCLQPFQEPPRLQLRYTVGARQVVQDLPLPLAPHKFMVPKPHIAKEAFFDKWKSYAGEAVQQTCNLWAGVCCLCWLAAAGIHASCTERLLLGSLRRRRFCCAGQTLLVLTLCGSVGVCRPAAQDAADAGAWHTAGHRPHRAAAARAQLWCGALVPGPQPQQRGGGRVLHVWAARRGAGAAGAGELAVLLLMLGAVHACSDLLAGRRPHTDDGCLAAAVCAAVPRGGQPIEQDAVQGDGGGS